MKAICGKKIGLVLCLIISASIALAVPKDKEKEKHSKDNSKSVGTQVSVGVFVAKERDMIRQHYVVHRASLPPGLAKQGGDLPPGLEKQLRRNGHLPPGLEKKLYPFPVVLEQRLPPLRPGLVRGIIGGSAVIIDKRTSVILDIFAVL